MIFGVYYVPKLENVRKKMAIVNTNILGLGEPRCINIEDFTSDDQRIIYACREMKKCWPNI